MIGSCASASRTRATRQRAGCPVPGRGAHGLPDVVGLCKARVIDHAAGCPPPIWRWVFKGQARSTVHRRPGVW